MSKYVKVIQINSQINAAIPVWKYSYPPLDPPLVSSLSVFTSFFPNDEDLFPYASRFNDVKNVRVKENWAWNDCEVFVFGMNECDCIGIIRGIIINCFGTLENECDEGILVGRGVDESGRVRGSWRRGYIEPLPAIRRDPTYLDIVFTRDMLLYLCELIQEKKRRVDFNTHTIIQHSNKQILERKKDRGKGWNLVDFIHTGIPNLA